MRVLVIGANGQTGRRIVKRLQVGPHTPVAMVRSPDQAGHFEEMGVATVVGDLEEPLDPALEASAAEALIFAAGSGSDTGPEKTLAVDRDGAIRSIAAMEAAGLRRFIMLSALGADPRSEGSSISPYLQAKGIADAHLCRSHLDYTVVRPGRLTSDDGAGDDGAGKVDIAPDPDSGGSISRDDVAAVMVACLDEESTVRTSFDLLTGATPIAEALANLQRGAEGPSSSP
jgi:uncharacterized protein YbjT (DUF2867 family)